MRLIPPEAVTNEVRGKTVVNACPAPNAWSISDFRSGWGRALVVAARESNRVFHRGPTERSSERRGPPHSGLHELK
jgi:hypothetical protein